MKNKMILVVVGLILIAALLMGVFGCAQPAPTGPITLKLQSHMPATHDLYLNGLAWAEMVTERTNGRVVFEDYPSSQLVPKAEALAGVNKGVIDLLLTGSVVYSSVNALLDFLWTPGLFSFQDQEALADAWFNKGLDKITNDSYQVSGVKILYLPPVNSVSLISTKPVRTLEDWQGLKVIVASASYMKCVELLGASGVVMATEERYTAIQRGTAEAVVWHLPTLKVYSMAEVVDYAIESPYLLPVPALAMYISLDVWNSLPADIQDVMMEAAKEQAYSDIGGLDQAEEEAKAIARENNIELITIPEAEFARWVEATASIKDYYLETCDKQGFGDAARQILSLAE